MFFWLQIFLYKRDKEWIAPKGYCFVKPLKAVDQFNIESEKPAKGINEEIIQF